MKATINKSSEECSRWMQHVHEVQSKRSPEAVEAARKKVEQARQREVSYRQCKAVKGHSVRSRALACEGLRQMAVSAPHEQMAVQGRWKNAQEASTSRKQGLLTKVSSVLAARSNGPIEEAAVEVLNDASDSEDEAMAEVANIVGAADAHSMAAVGAEGVETQTGTGVRGSREAETIENLLSQLKQEPQNGAECAAKFMLYESYAPEVEQIRNDLFKFLEENRPTIPAAVITDMDKQARNIDSAEAMGIPDDTREWFVYHMMRQAERNNKKLAGILDAFEKKLQFLAVNDQTECPICLECFEDGGVHAPETLGCCHKVCKDCWTNWSTIMHGRPFCPLCRNEEFLGAVASRVSGAHAPMATDSDDEP